MKKEKEKTERERLAATGSRDAGYGGRGFGNGGPPPSGPANRPRERVWGKPQDGPPQQPGSWGQNRNPGFVRGSEDVPITGPDKVAGETEKTDEELERERKLARERQEEHSFRDVSVYQRTRGSILLLTTIHLARTSLRTQRTTTDCGN